MILGQPYWRWLVWALWLGVGFFGVFPGIVAYMVWGERKVAARFQDRIGPNRVGPFGLLVPIADALKLITKESIVPTAADRWAHLAAPLILIVSAFLVLGMIPFGIVGSAGPDGVYPALVATALPSSLLLLVAAAGLSTLGIFLAGWSSRNKFALLGAMRAVAQLVSYEVPQVLATVPIVLWAGSLSLGTIVSQQFSHGWFLFSPPGLLAFAILTIASVAEVNRAPFDIPEAESEIIAGFHTEYSGMRFGLFFLAEYMNVFGVSCLGTVLFLGGGSLPGVHFAPAGSGTGAVILANLMLLPVFGLKLAGYIFMMFWIRATLPRLRVDRLMEFAWKFLVPLGIANIPIAAVWYECVYRDGRGHRLLGWGLTLPLVLAALAGAFALNRSRPGAGPVGASRGGRVAGLAAK